MRTAGRCRHRPLRNSIENPCVGADAYIGPVAPIFKSCVGRRALTPPRWRSGYRTAGWGQPALQCLAPLPKGGLGGRIATASVRTDLAMTGFPWSVVHGRRATARVAPTEGYKECLAGGRTGVSAPTGGVLMVPCAAGHMGPAAQGTFVGQVPRALPGVREKTGRADVGIGPYGSATRGAMGGRPQGSPLRKRYKGCGKAGGVYRMCFKFVKKLSCLFGAVAVQCFRRFFASKFALHPG